MLDLPKDFDCCDHEILLDKLFYYVIEGVPHKLFSNYSNNRTQCTKIRAFKYSCKMISWVPQGSVLGSLLLRICINDITQASFHTTYLLMVLAFVCPILVSLFFRQLSVLKYVKLTTD